MASSVEVRGQAQTVARAGASSRARVLAVDALRGLALLAMALDHAAFFVGTGLQAESYGGAAVSLQSLPYWLSGLLTNMAAPIFWLLSGVSLALLESSQRARGVDEAGITRFMLIRAAVILALDLTVCALAWRGDYPYVHVLATIAVAMAILSVARLLPQPLLLGLGAAALLGYQGWLLAIGPTMAEATGLAEAVWVGFSYQTVPAIGFPVLGWGPLMWLGFSLGRQLDRPALRRPRTWAVGGLALLGLWLGLRLLGGYGDFGAYGQIGASPAHWLIMSKAPPSLTFFAFNLGLAALLMAALMALSGRLDRAPFTWLTTVGQVSLCFYVVHLWVYNLVATLIVPLNLPVIALARGYGAFLLGLPLLLAICTWYRTLRKAHPNSVLRYL